jgi:PAS domain S-box-containing protein
LRFDAIRGRRDVVHRNYDGQLHPVSDFDTEGQLSTLDQISEILRVRFRILRVVQLIFLIWISSLRIGTWNRAKAHQVHERDCQPHWEGLSERFTMSTMAKDDLIPVDHQSMFFRQIIDSSPALIHTGRPDGYLDFFNQGWLNFLGLPLERLLGWQWTSFIHPEDVEAFVQKWRDSIVTGQNFEGTARVRRADGEYRWMLHHKVAMRSDDGEIIKWHGSSVDIDGQKRAEEQLLESVQEVHRSEAYLAEAQRLSHTGSFGWKPGCEEHVWSDETYRIFEYSPRDKITLDMILARVHPEDRNFVLETVERASISGGAIDYEYRLLFPDDRIKNVHVLARPLETNSGDLEFAGAVIDITEAKRAEERIRLSEKELQILVEAIPAYVGTNLPDGSLDFISQSWLDYTGLSREQWIGWGWVSTIHPEDVDRVVANWRAALAAGLPVEYQLRCRGADGIYHWFLYRGVPFCDEGGKVVKWYSTVTNIDVLKKTESALQSREQQLVGIIETIPAMLWSLWPNGEPSHLSKRFLEYFGAPFEEFLNGGWVRIIHRDDLEETGKLFACALETGELFNVINLWRRADGEYRWHHTMGEPLRDPDGKIVQWYGISVDIDDRKRAEETVRKSERELRTLIDVMPAIVGVSLPDGTVEFLSQSWLDYFGQTREEAMGGGWTSVIHPDDVDRVVANRKAGLASGDLVVQELRCRGADGVYRWFLNRSLPIRDDEGKVVKSYGMLFDIDVLKKTESALQMREHELVGIIETIPSMLWSVSPTGETTHLSQRFLDYFGVRFEELINRGWHSFIHPEDREETVKSFARAISSGESYRAIHRLRRADGEYRWYNSMGEPLRDPQGKIMQWYGLSVDIDDRKRAEDHLRDTRIKLAKASRLTTVAELAGSIAHELNQPLTSILANAQAAKRWLIAAPPNVTEVNSSIERTIRDARAADETMQHIRALFKRESFVKKDVKIPDILNEVVRIVQEDPKKRAVPVECHFDESLPAIPVDQIQVQQVFINLIVNAIEASEGQQVAPLVTLRAVVTDSDRMLIQVIDNGPGVHDRERIFDAFMTTKEKGMGIGLAVSRSIVEAHGGRLWAENNKAGGAIFNVALPLSHASLTTA